MHDRKGSRVAVLGGGLAGLAAARALADAGTRPTVYESQEDVGGLARSRDLSEGPYDLAGGRFFVPRDDRVNAFVFRHLPREAWEFERVRLRFRIDGGEHGHPPFRYVLGGMRDLVRRRGPEPADLGAWLYWAYGKTFAKRFLLPFVEKVWGVDPRELYPLKQGENIVVPGLVGLPPLTLLRALRALLGERPRETSMPVGYPRSDGMGALPAAIAAQLPDVRRDTRVARLVRDGQGWRVNDDGRYDAVLSTIPLPTLAAIMDDAPAEVRDAAAGLRWASMTSACFVADPAVSPRPSLVFVFDETVKAHRFVTRRGPGGHRVTVIDRLGRVTPDDLADDVKHLAMGTLIATHYTEEAYPIFDLGFLERRAVLMRYFRDAGVDVIGRWSWLHESMDSTIREALDWVAAWLDRTVDMRTGGAV